MLLMVVVVNIARSDDRPADSLSPQEIFKKAQNTYDSLTSYSDKGKTVNTTYDQAVDADINRDRNKFNFIFTTQLARPNLYLIKWALTDDPSQSITKRSKIAVWSAGEGDFWDIGNGPVKQKDQHWVLLRQSADSGGATVGIPGAFFKTHWSNPLDNLGPNAKREADDKVEDIDCYVISKGDTVKITLWIGKQDFLIHQIRCITTGQMNVTTTETHSNIVVNQNFLPTDFIP